MKRFYRYPMSLVEEEPGIWRTRSTMADGRWLAVQRLLLVNPSEGAWLRDAYIGVEESLRRSLFKDRRVSLPIFAKCYSTVHPASHTLPEPFAILRPTEVLTVEIEGTLSGGIGIVCREVSPKERVYLSWADSKHNGIAIVEVERAVEFTEAAWKAQFLKAVRRAHELGFSPGGQCAGWVVPEGQEHCYDDVLDRLLTGDEALEVGRRMAIVVAN